MGKLFGDRLKDARKAKRMTLQEIADALGVSLNTVWRWEAGRQSPPDDQKKLIANALDVSVSYLLGEVEVIKSGMTEVRVFDLVSGQLVAKEVDIAGFLAFGSTFGSRSCMWFDRPSYILKNGTFGLLCMYVGRYIFMSVQTTTRRIKIMKTKDILDHVTERIEALEGIIKSITEKASQPLEGNARYLTYHMEGAQEELKNLVKWIESNGKW